MRVLNLGAGVQSSTIYLMMVDGDIPACDVAIFADTGEEPQAVYDHLGWLKKQGGPEKWTAKECAACNVAQARKCPSAI